MSKKIVRRSVSVTDPETGQSVWLHDGDTVPSWATDLITNPAVFVPLGGNPDGPTVEDLPDAEVQPVDYNALSHAELDVLLDERGLSTSGSKADKVGRLEEHDASQS